MKKENLFYLLLLFTIIIIRILVYIFSEIDIKFGPIIIHHFWFGTVVFVVGFVIPKKYGLARIYFYASGAGLIVDQLVFMLLGAGKDLEYWSPFSLLGVLVLVFMIFPFRKKIVDFLILSPQGFLIPK